MLHDVLLKLQRGLLPHTSIGFYFSFSSSWQAQTIQPVFLSLHDFHYLWLISPCRYSLLLINSRAVAIPGSSWGLGVPTTPSSLEVVSILWILCKVTSKFMSPSPFPSLSHFFYADRLEAWLMQSRTHSLPPGCPKYTESWSVYLKIL